jgi:hypothetical protein
MAARVQPGIWNSRYLVETNAIGSTPEHEGKTQRALKGI